MVLMEQLTSQFMLLWLVVGRVAGILFVAPFFGSRYFPAQVKIGLAVAISLILLPIVNHNLSFNPEEIYFTTYISFVVKEVVIGLAIGFLAGMLFSAIYMAGQLIDVEMGFGLVNVFDPQYGQSVPLIGNFLYMLSLVLLVALNGHHLLLRALMESYLRLPVGMAAWDGGVASIALEAFAWMFVTAVKLSIPIVAALFLTTISLGILGRTMPQLNVFVVGIPLKIMIGLILLLLFIPLFGSYLTKLVEDILVWIVSLIEVMKP